MLTDLLKKDSLNWLEPSTKAFEQLKLTMTRAPASALSDLEAEFKEEIDASGFDVGVVLMQQGHSIAFSSKKLYSRIQSGFGLHK